MQEADLFVLGCLLLTSSLLLTPAPVSGCVCPAASILAQFPSEVPLGVCCLNLSGSSLGRVDWTALTNGTDLETLDLSACDIHAVDATGAFAPALRTVYLSHNRLTALPRDFLSGLPGLEEVDLSQNRLEELPQGFLEGSDNLRSLDLRGNRLRLLPDSVLRRPALQNLELEGNRWFCSCPLLEALDGAGNRSAGLRELLGNLTCASPPHLSGRRAGEVRRAEACGPAGLTALFIALPLVILAGLVLCWCCGRKRRKRKKEAPAFGSRKKKKNAAAAANGHKHPSVAGGRSQAGAEPEAEPGAEPAHLGSTRDIYEEVEIKLGSVESLPPGPSHCSAGGKVGGATRAEQLDTVSVTEVMKDSADREKAYMTQSTEYYSLVPGLELDDSDHGEYENVDLS